MSRVCGLNRGKTSTRATLPPGHLRHQVLVILHRRHRALLVAERCKHALLGVIQRFEASGAARGSEGLLHCQAAHLLAGDIRGLDCCQRAGGEIAGRAATSAHQPRPNAAADGRNEALHLIAEAHRTGLGVENG